MSNFDRIDPAIRLRQMQEEALRRGLKLPLEVKAQLLREEAGKRGLLIFPTFKSFVHAVHPELLEHKYHRVQIALAQQVIDGKLPRLMVFVPTQYGKSEIWSRLLPAYYLLRFAKRRVALASFGADLAWELSGDARDNYARVGGRFREGSAKGASRNWRTQGEYGAKGGMWAVGIGGTALGRGFNLGIVDDPISPQHASRTPYLRRFQNWWSGQWLRAQAPTLLGGNAIVFIMQRLDIMDPAAWLLEREKDYTEKWHILALDEIHSSEPYGHWGGPQGFPPTCTVEQDWRKVGQVLAPKFRTEQEVADIQRVSSPLVRAAQRQQRPMRPEGDFWKESYFKDRVYDTLPADAFNGGWDLDTAYTKDEANSGSSGIRSYRGPGPDDKFPIYIDDVRLEYLEFPKIIDLLRNQLKGPYYVEAKATGKSVVQTLKTYDIVAEEVQVKGDKLARASAAQPAVTTGRVFIRRAIYERLMAGDQGLLRVTAEALQLDGEGLDINDAFVQCIFRHLRINSKDYRLIFR